MAIHVSIIRAWIEFERKGLKPLIWCTILKGNQTRVGLIIRGIRVGIKADHYLVFDVRCVLPTLNSHSVRFLFFGTEHDSVLSTVLLPSLIK